MTEENKPKRYITKRTKMWRDCELAEMFVSTLDRIEQYGCAVLHIPGDAAAPRLSYTVGAYDTAGKPELITIGLTEPAARFALNEATALMKSGLDLTIGRHHGILGEVECEFHRIDPKWVQHVMGRAAWYYEDADIPVLQLIYPDLENRFQTDDGFTEYFRQPILTPGAQQTELETDFWAANDPSSSLFDWKFPDSPHTRVFLSQTVQDQKEKVTYVSHDADDGAWQFLGDLMSDGGGPVLSCFHHPIDNDPTLKELHDLPIGWYAVRDKPGDPWERYKHDKEPDEEHKSSTD